MGMDIRNLIYILPAVIIVLTLHEYSHAKVSDMLGDPTPRNRGRLTLNPLAHIDPLGLLMLVLIRLGWAKPVPTSPLYYKNRKKGTLYVALAGPASGILLALVIRVITASGILRWTGIPMNFFSYIYFYSLVISVFNLLPVYPLDGSRILQGLLPNNKGMKLIQYQNQIQIVFILVLLLGSRFLWSILNPVIGIFDFIITGVVGLLL